MRPAVRQRLGDGLAGDELLAHQPHGHVDALADHRLAAARDQAGQRRRQAALAVRRGQLAGDEQAPGRGVDEQRRAAARGATASRRRRSCRGSARRAWRASGMRSSASARHISATPSWLDSEYSWIRPSTPPERALPRSASVSLRARSVAALVTGAGRVASADEQGEAFRLRPAVGAGDLGAQHALRLDVLGELQEGLEGGVGRADPRRFPAGIRRCGCRRAGHRRRRRARSVPARTGWIA